MMECVNGDATDSDVAEHGGELQLSLLLMVASLVVVGVVRLKFVIIVTVIDGYDNVGW